ncbi:MAG: tRNA (N(6)-L-threonylcarbamoyladenosine(37)-C(2))-methylthiotransferase MtaB [Rhizobiales bacterium]|nr:tRNA (N(6)-L-threonylcarbamoyladenosine(37)-C(2))-methylthiotransferase MtaB [Hyphomicrobiales bacterium]
MPEVITLGCRLNIAESEAMRRAALEAGHSDIIIVNTCAVTSEAVRQARQTIRKLGREKPGQRIIVTGCAAQTEPGTFAAMAEVSQVIGNDLKLRSQTWHEVVKPAGMPFLPDEGGRVVVNDIMSVKETAGHFAEGFEAHTRGFVQIQNGCDHRCTFCIIPYGRGNSRSVPMGEVVRQIERLVEAGCPEIVLTGVDLTSYGPDLPGSPTLGSLVAAILRHVPKLDRLRLSSLDCIEADPLLLDILKGENRLLPHLHLSLQSGDDMILKRMRRRHSRADSIRFCAELRTARPDFVFGADFIAGFPTETEAMFENTLRLVEECGLTFLHVFPFSPRKGTPAARMPQLDGTTIKQRAARLREAGETRLSRHLAGYAGRVVRVLTERNGIGRLDDFTPVRLESPAVPGQLVNAWITGTRNTMLAGEVMT